MQFFRKAVAVAVAAAGAMVLQAPVHAGESPVSTNSEAIEDLVRRSQEANAALMRGDVQGYREFVTLADDFSFFSPFGGEPSRAAAFTDERFKAMGEFFKDGSLETQLVEAYGTHDLVVLALVERAKVAAGGLPTQDWWLRVTLVYRREGDRWLLAHRHADPLRHGVSLEQAAALARGTPK